jgi:hypothetical protein
MSAVSSRELRIFWIQRVDGSLQMVWGAEVLVVRRKELIEGCHGR